MTIAAFISKTNPADQVLGECLQRIAENNPELHIIIFSEDAIPDHSLKKNMTPVTVQPALRNGLLLHYWSQYKLPYLLRRYHADIFISENSVICLRAKIPQLLIISDAGIANDQFPEYFSFRTYLNKLFPYFTRRASAILTTENPISERIRKKYKLANEKMKDISFGVTTKQLSWTEKDEMMGRLTDGNDYFLFIYDKTSAAFSIEVLKAFSIFKKWQKSSIQLLLMSSGEDIISVKDLHLYKYRDEVKIFHPSDKQELEQVIGSAYALIQFNGSRIAFQSMAAGVPAIISDNGINRERFEDSARYTQAKHKEISEQMMRIYKDENEKNQLILKAYELTRLRDWDNTSLRLWETIVEHAEG